MMPFDQVLNRCDNGWSLSVMHRRKLVRKLALPMPEATLAEWLLAVGLEPLTYRCFLRAKGQNRTERREELKRFGPLQVTIDLAAGELLDTTPALVAELEEPDGSGAGFWAEREATAIAKARALQAEDDLRQFQARQHKLGDEATRGMSTFELEITREIRELREARVAPAGPDPMALMFKTVMDQNKVLLEIIAGAKAPPPVAGPAPTASRMMGEMEQLLGIMSMLRESAGVEAPTRDIQTQAMDLIAQTIRAKQQQTVPAVSPETPAAVTAGAPAAGPPPPIPVTPDPAPREVVVAPAVAPPDPGRQRVELFLDLVQTELRNQTVPADAAYQIEDTDVYRLLPGPLRDAIGAGSMADVLREFERRLPPQRWTQLRDLVTTDASARQWLQELILAFTAGDEDKDQPDLALVASPAVDGTPDG